MHPLEIEAEEADVDEAVEYLQGLQSLSKGQALSLCIYLMDTSTDRDAGRRPRNDKEVNQWLVYGSEIIRQSLEEMKRDEAQAKEQLDN